MAEWRERLADFTGQWCVVQDTLEAAVDPQTIANGYMQDCETADGMPFKLVAAPVQFGGARPSRAGRPSTTSTAMRILEELGIDWDTIVDLKVRAVVGLTPTIRPSSTGGHTRCTLFDAFRYDGKRVLVVGGATGMGAAAAELVQDAGAEVVVMDFAEVKLPGAKAIHVTWPTRTPSTPPSTSAAGRCTRCSPAPAWPTAPPGSRRSTSSATAT